MTHYKLGAGIQAKTVSNNQRVKVAIVGAGMSGLYSAWRLQNEAGIEDFAILERSNRTGGRLDSDLVNFKNQHHEAGEPEYIEVKEEQGGMRFLFDDMDTLMALFLSLDLEDQIVPFPMNSGGNNRLSFRGKSFSVNDAQKDDYAIWSELYNLAPSEQGVNPKDIVNVVFNRILKANPQFKARPESKGPEFWQNFRLDCKWNGKALNQWTLWDLFTDMGYSQECITMLYRVLGFNGTFLSGMNAGVAYQLLEDFPANVQFKTFTQGFSTLPNALVKQIGTEKIHLETSVEGIEFDECNQEYILTLKQGPCGKETKLIAEKVILGLPRLALEKLFLKSNAFNNLPVEKSEPLWNTLQSASNQPLLKINLYYDSAWWGEGSTGRPAVEFGPNFADLPTGSVYPFYAVDEKLAAQLMYQESGQTASKETQLELDKVAKAKYKKPAALTIYCDYMNINFWSALQASGPKYQHPNQQDYVESVPADMYPATTAVVEQATKFFKEIFNTHYVPAPILTSARIWQGSVNFDVPAEQQFGYGVHQWAVGADDRQVMKDLVEPLPNLFTCGEAFSDYQGWVEGALRSTDLVLQQGFNLNTFASLHPDASIVIREKYNARRESLINKYFDLGYRETTEVEKSECHIETLQTVLGVDLTYFDKA
ncbi:amine oxidoreductase [Pseudoalteromonas phenolica]|uniref:FAD-dependent L-amino acid oxidase n=1 Tax=Pseudoalteromonas phenolica TaxID=161398 RepID=UPI00110AB4B4|nr:amine oxidoreductase [Pseudoalteromonas phenolica]